MGKKAQKLWKNQSYLEVFPGRSDKEGNLARNMRQEEKSKWWTRESKSVGNQIPADRETQLLELRD